MTKTIMSLACLTALLLAIPTVSRGGDSKSATSEQESKAIAVLKSSATQLEKSDACRELARIGTRAAVAPLAELLGNEKLSHMARYGLEPIPDPAVDAALRDAATKLKGRLLVGVIGSIGVRRDAKAVDLLADQLKNSDADVMQAARARLGVDRQPLRPARPWKACWPTPRRPTGSPSRRACSAVPRPWPPMASVAKRSPSTHVWIGPTCHSKFAKGPRKKSAPCASKRARGCKKPRQGREIGGRSPLLQGNPGRTSVLVEPAPPGDPCRSRLRPAFPCSRKRLSKGPHS